MKFYTLKITAIALLLGGFVFSGSSLLAQKTMESTNSQSVLDETPNYDNMTSEQVKQDFTTRLAKYDELYNKLKAKSEKTKNPEMQTDITNLLSKMETLKTDMTSYQNGSSAMSKDQQKQSVDRIHTEMDDLRQMHTDMKTKYGGEKSGKSSKQGQMDQSPK